MNRIRRTAGAVSILATLAAGMTLPTAGLASASTSAVKTIVWDYDIHRGDCTLFHEAKLMLTSDGKARFEGVVTSGDDNDAWLMWLTLKDRDGAVLASVYNDDPVPGDSTKFVKNLPNHRNRYRWFAYGTFDRGLYPLIKRVGMRASC
ncbi:hypothetical protein FLW53_21195 [Microbispora sp. SCL1-1]|uniref:DUF6294 family protein n=1 Tax=unclassified Microbispora TaxID=2614687 RepID=UPI001156D941|nr:MULTISPECIES: DUF6294 family protein [unclassified Microbispora]NJP26661.1 hypothetical protein [Microbispora sp. CL1-1]TQS12158.1 hypothetical protein FLW53_21195 [Microbispora sp. SCL1-1]